MPILTRSKDALEKSFKTPIGAAKTVANILPTPTSLSPCSEKKNKKNSNHDARCKRVRLSTGVSATATVASACTHHSREGDSWSGRSKCCKQRSSGGQKSLLQMDPQHLRSFLNVQPLSLSSSPQLDYLIDLERRTFIPFSTDNDPPRFTATCPLSRHHYDLVMKMVMAMGSNLSEAPINTTFAAFSLLARYLNKSGRRVAGKPLQEAMVCAAVLLTFKLVEEEVDVEGEVAEVVRALGLGCSERQVLQAERRLCAGLSWSLLGPPTPEEALFALLDSMDEHRYLDYVCKSLLVQCCAEIVTEYLFLSADSSVIVTAAASLLALLQLLSPGLLIDNVLARLKDRYGLAVGPECQTFMLGRFRSFQQPKK